MAQHDYNIANQSGADFRADLNNALSAIVTVNSGATEPTTTFAHQLWVDTANSVLKIRNAADNAWYTTGISITASNTFTGDLTGNVVGNVTGMLVGDVTGDLTGNADTATTLATARTISLSGDVAGSASFDGSGDITITTTAQIDSIALGTDTTGDYVESMSGGTGVTVTGGTGEGSTPSVAIGQAVATTDDVTFNTITATDQFIGDIRGAVRFNAKADGALSKGDVVYISGVSGDVATVGQAKADDASKMPAFGFAAEDANDNAAVEVVTFGTLAGLDTSGVSEGQVLYVSTTAGEYTTTKPTGESALLQNIGKVQRSHAAEGSIKVGGAGRSNATPNLNNGKIFIGNASNQAVTATLDTSIVVENTNLYYTTTRANTDFDTRLATKDTGDLTEGSNLYYTTARVNSDFDTRLATKDTGDLTEGVNLYYTDARVNSAFDTRLATKDTDDLSEGATNLYYTSTRANTDFDTRLATKSTTNLAEGTNLYYTSARFDSAFTSKDTDDLSEGVSNLYYTTARFDSAFGNKTTADLTENTNLYYTDARANSAIDTRVTKAFVDALNVQAASVDANSVTLGTDTTGNYVATITGTANKISVSGSGSESADITLSLPDDVQIASDLTVAGNLTVNGTLTSLDTTNLDIEDNLFQLNAGLTGSPVNDSGMLINRGTADNGIFMWDESVDKFTLGLTTADGSATGNITLNSLGTLVANIEGDVTGDVTGTVSSISNHSTSDLSEGTNLYYTDARFDTRLATKDTDDVSEGATNLYYTSARFDSAFGGKSTTDLSEGTNLYYTSARTNSDFDTRLATKDTGDLAEGTNLYYTDARAQAVSINNVVEDTTPQLGGNLASNGNDILFADSDKAVFGAGSDLQIYHDGSNSFIRDAGTGNLVIRGTSLNLQKDGGESYITMVADGAVTLFYDNASKLATTSTGIDVTGTVTADGLTVDTSTLHVDATNNRVGIGTTSPARQLHVNSGSTNVVARFESTDSRAVVEFKDPSGTAELGNIGNEIYFAPAGVEKVRIDSSGNVGIGTTSPNNKLVISNSGAGGFEFSPDTTAFSVANSNYIASYDRSASAYRDIVFDLGGVESQSIRFKAGGNVGIGTSSPGHKLTVNASAFDGVQLQSGGSDCGYLGVNTDTVYVGAGSNLIFHTGNAGLTNGSERMRIDSSGKAIFKGVIENELYSQFLSAGSGSTVSGYVGRASSVVSGGTATDLGVGGGAGNLVFAAGGASERMRIDSSGRVGIGESSPDKQLHIKDSGAVGIVIESTDNAQNLDIDFYNNVGSAQGRIRYAEGAGSFGFAPNVSASDALHILYSGRVGLGTTSPTGSLHISNVDDGGSDVHLHIQNTTANRIQGLKILDESGTSQINLSYDNGGNNSSFIIKSLFGSTASNPAVKYNATSGLIYYDTSSIRYKENVQDLPNSLEKIKALRPVTFDEKSTGDSCTGLIAEEVVVQIPDLVHLLDVEGYDTPQPNSVDYAKLSVYLLKAIQEQQTLIENLTARIEQLEN